MKKLKLLFLCMLIPFIGKTQTVMQRVCYVVSENKIYTPVVPILNTALLANAYSTTCPDGSTSATQVYLPSSSGSGTCTVLLGTTVVAFGVIRNSYTITNCNLDDYSWTLGAAAGLFGIFVIKRRNKL